MAFKKIYQCETVAELTVAGEELETELSKSKKRIKVLEKALELSCNDIALWDDDSRDSEFYMKNYIKDAEQQLEEKER